MVQPDWLIIELSDQAEGAGYPEIESALNLVFGEDSEFFIPMYHEQMGSYISTNTLFEGYVFVKDSAETRECLSNIRESRYLAGALKMAGKIRTVNSRTITALRKKLTNSLRKKIGSGMKVKVIEGIFQNLEGEVLNTEDNGRIANVRIRCLSREIIAPMPTTCFQEIR